MITRGVSERLFDFCFELARQRKARGRPGHVTCVDKANVFAAFAFFRKIFEERAEKYPDIGASSAYVDATALDMVRRPWTMDVLVTENMFGDILSDLGAGLMGGMGMAPSADIGDTHAVFQPCHGTAPDIVGQGKANPTAMFLSGAMMLEWLGTKHSSESAIRAARLIEAAVSRAYVGKAPQSVRTRRAGRHAPSRLLSWKPGPAGAAGGVVCIRHPQAQVRDPGPELLGSMAGSPGTRPG